MINELPASLTVIFDGYCGVCTRTVEWLLSHDRDERLTVVPCQATRGVDRFGVSREQCETRVWAVATDGYRAAGAQAMMLILAVMWQRPWPMTVGRLPIISQLLALGYGLVTRHRHRFTGTTPWCEVHPGECLPECEIPSS